MPTYHVIPHTHWDREWYLSFDAFRVRLVHMMDDLLDILEAREDYRGFLLDGQTVVLDDYLEIRPERRDEIAEHVRSDRLWTGPWYVLPDTLLVSGEALIRNLMRGRSTARALGGTMDIGYIPDSFGHTAQIPQILRGFQMDTAVVWRGFGGEPGQEGSEYRWRSPDGSEVLMEHLSDVGYSGGYFDRSDEQSVEERFEAIRSRVDARARTPERLILSGGDHHWPVRYLPEAIDHLNTAHDGSARIIHSSLRTFFDALTAAVENLELPLVEGELLFGYRWAFNVTGGVYSSRMYLKQANAAGQRLLERYLEPLNALAVSTGGRSQRALIDHGWTYLLQNHPHDSICGCSIDPVHREMMSRFEKLQELGGGVETFAWMSLAPGPEGVAGDDSRLVFFNPSPFRRSEVVRCEVSFFRQKVLVGLNPDVTPEPAEPPVDGFVLIDAEDREVPFEVVNRESGHGIAYTRYGYPTQTRVDRFFVDVPLEGLPPLGLRELRVERRAGSPATPRAELHIATSSPAGAQFGSSSGAEEESVSTPGRAAAGSVSTSGRADEGSVATSGRGEHSGGERRFASSSDRGRGRSASSTNGEMSSPRSSDAEVLSASERTVQNAFLRLEVLEDGSFHVTDRASGMRFGPLGYLEDGADAGDEYNYSPPPQDRVLRSTDSTAVTIQPAGGRFRKGLRVQGTWRVPAGLSADLTERSADEAELAFETTAWLTASARHVTFETTIENAAEDHRLRVVFETGRRTNRHYADNAFAVVAREQRAYDPAEFSIEVPAAVAPMHRFVIVEDDAAGAAIFADGLPEYELKHDSGGEVALTLLRCVGQLGRENVMMRPGGKAGWHNETPDAQCPGTHAFRYAFMPLAPQWPAQMPQINAAAESLLLPVRWRAGKSTDPLYDDRYALRIAPRSLVLSAFKEAEDGDGFVLRIYNPTGEPLDGTVDFGNEVHELRRADLEETPGDLLAPHAYDFRDTWGPFRIHTYRFKAPAIGLMGLAFMDDGPHGDEPASA